ncbi:MAG: hypothetical protein WC835_01460 [Candidatus Paceibacterota bacterium]|jgi:hypothetical protein
MFSEKLTAKYLIALILLGSFIFPAQKISVVSAQGIGTDPVLVEMEPEFPKPEETVSIKLTSYSTDLDRAKIVWTLNGKTVKSGVGGKTFSFGMGPAGKSVTFGVTVDSQDIGIFEKKVTLNPAQVDILWQAIDSYTPPFYRGKALPAKMSKIRVLAMPDMKTKSGGAVKSTDLIYKWTLGDAPMLDSSGYAKNFADFSLDFVSSDASVKVNASSIKEAGLVAENIAYFTTVDPKIIFYENKPLKGISYENAAGNSFDLKNNEVSIVAEPYYFTSQNGRSSLSYNWLINGIPTQPVNQRSLVLRIGDQKSGSSEISLGVKQVSRFLQAANKTFTINFGQ